MTPETTLIIEAQQGDEEAFRKLVNMHARRVFAVAYDLSGNYMDAEDLVQEVFIKMYRSLDRFRMDSRLDTWIYRITVNTWLNHKKSKLFRIRQTEMTINDEVNSNQIRNNSNMFGENDSDIRDQIEAGLTKLSQKEKAAFVLRHYQDLKLKEVAEIIKVSTGTVKSLLHRAGKKLQKHLAPQLNGVKYE